MLSSKLKAILSNRLVAILVLVALCVALGNFLVTHKQAPQTTPTPLPIAKNGAIEQLIQDLAPPKLELPTIPATKPTIYAKAYLVMDNKTKYPMAAKNPDMRVPIASTTKIMTALVALETLKLDQVVTVSRHSATIEGSEINLMTGEQMTVQNLLYALLLNSANDAAYALSEANGSTEAFVAQMNAKAKLLGLRNTQYADPSGLDDRGYSTPRDLALLLNYVLDNPTYRQIISTSKYTIWSADNKYKHDLSSSDRLIQPDEPLYYPQAIGGKTGFTYEAGHCLIVAAEYADGKRLIASVLNTNESTNDASAKEARKLLVWAAQH